MLFMADKRLLANLSTYYKSKWCVLVPSKLKDILAPSTCIRLRFVNAYVFRPYCSTNRPFSYSTKEPGSSDIFIQFSTRGSIEWR